MTSDGDALGAETGLDVRLVAGTSVPPARSEMLALIDQTLLRADATPAEIEVFCEEAARYGFGHVCVNGTHVARAARVLAPSTTAVCAVAGFPLGASVTQAKAHEAFLAVADGASEVDMVIDLGSLKAGDRAAVEMDISAVVAASSPAATVKVIIETCYLTDDEKRLACAIAESAGAAFVKTSTGFGPAGATVVDVALMSAAVARRLGVKASGGVRDLATALAMISAGATRIGTSNGPAIVDPLSSMR